MDFSIIERAGLTQLQFGKLVGVSRVTVNTWVKGRFKPRSDLRARVAKATRLLDAAIIAGQLPVPAIAHSTRVEHRLALVYKDLVSAVS